MFFLLLIATLFVLGCQPEGGGADLVPQEVKASPVQNTADRMTLDRRAAAESVSLVDMRDEQSEWHITLRRCGPNTVSLEGGKFFPDRTLKSTYPPLVSIENVTVRKARGVFNETVFVVEGDVVGASALESLRDARVFVKMEGLIFQENPGSLRGSHCVWEQTGFKQWITDHEEKRLYLVDAPFFQDWALKPSGTLVLIAYCDQIPTQAAQEDDAEYYILGGTALSFDLSNWARQFKGCAASFGE
ncbi:MAG: hypothetical protein JW741_11180 [Sedimentisphaerales bacterium]|nr:hypothetical protein [Sedimentisphaerales bacterium]